MDTRAGGRNKECSSLVARGRDRNAFGSEVRDCVGKDDLLAGRNGFFELACAREIEASLVTKGPLLELTIGAPGKVVINDWLYVAPVTGCT